MAKTKTEETVETVYSVETTSSGIEIANPDSFRPKVLPLIIKLPDTANAAQKEFVKVLNGYAYSHPDKWNNGKKEELIAILEKINESNYKELTGVSLVDKSNAQLFVGKPIPTE